MITSTEAITFAFVLICFIGAILMKRALATCGALAVSLGVILYAFVQQNSFDTPINNIFLIPIAVIAVFECYMAIMEALSGDMI